MLNKEICKKCCVEQPIDTTKYGYPLSFIMASPKRRKLLRERSFERKWKKLHCPCNFHNKSAYIKVTAEPPNECPYILEHTLYEPDRRYRWWLKWKKLVQNISWVLPC